MQQGRLGACRQHQWAQTVLEWSYCVWSPCFTSAGAQGCEARRRCLCGRDAVCSVNNLSWCLLPTVTCGGDVCSHVVLLLPVRWGGPKYTFPESLETIGTGRVTRSAADQRLITSRWHDGMSGDWELNNWELIYYKLPPETLSSFEQSLHFTLVEDSFLKCVHTSNLFLCADISQVKSI